MNIDPNSGQSVLAGQRPTERGAANPAGTEANRNNAGQVEAGQTSSYGPAVVANLSVAMLESSRAATAPDQAADTEDNNDVVEGEEKGQNSEKPKKVVPVPGERGERPHIDLKV